jgi:adenylate cyclase
MSIRESVKKSTNVKYPLAFKFIAVSIFLVLAVVITITFQISNKVTEKSQNRESDANSEQATARAEEISTLIYSYSMRARFLASIIIQNNQEGSLENNALIQNTFFVDGDFLAIGVYGITDSKPTLVKSIVKEEFYKDFGIANTGNIFASLESSMNSVFSGEILVFNRSAKLGAPVWTLAVPLAKNANGEISHIVFSDLRLARLQKSFSKVGPRTLYLVDSHGNVLAHTDEKLALQGSNLKDSLLVKKAIEAKENMGQLNFSDKSERWVGAFAKTGLGPIVLAQVKERIVLETALLIRNDILIITGLAISIAIFLIFVFSLTITNPLVYLVKIMNKVATGELNLKVVVKTQDEIGLLSKAFMGMLDGLKERDKIKNVLDKFHGSTVAKDLLRGNLKLGGSKKNVTIFFCDIRDFSNYCERANPEEVVEMLNEYFSTMVAIITKWNGIVDKFIGDAIMAVWGIPDSTGKDEMNAVNACLEMRLALNSMNEHRIKAGKQPILIGMGLNYGSAISGIIGSSERMEYTVVGESVNLASRIEAATKKFGTDLLISESMASIIAKHFVTASAGNTELKGISQPITLYRVLGRNLADGSQQIIKTPYSDFKPYVNEQKIKISS